MDVTPVLEFLRRRIGLNSGSIGASFVEKAIVDCMEELNVTTLADYMEAVTGDHAALDRLVEKVVVRETYFFRDVEPFAVLKEYLKNFWLNRNGAEPLRVLSVPCSTGEEPYSIAMLLFDMKIKKDRFVIDAADISERALEQARSGIYTAYSFRMAGIEYRERYFSKHGDLYAIDNGIREAVNFRKANILSGVFPDAHHGYDIIFCRNLLIYFDNESKEKAISVLSRLLFERGVIFVGHAETTRLSASGFVRLAYPRAFAFARPKYAREINATLSDSPLAPDEPVSNCVLPIRPVRPVAALKKAASMQQAKETVKEEKGDKKDAGVDAKLARARMLIEAEAFEEAGPMCEELAEKMVDSSEAYHLLGRVVEARGDIYLAEEYLKKAVYLDPGSHEALESIASLYERIGDAQKAAELRNRARRVKQRSAGNN